MRRRHSARVLVLDSAGRVLPWPLFGRGLIVAGLFNVFARYCIHRRDDAYLRRLLCVHV